MSKDVDEALERDRCEAVSAALDTLARKPGGLGPAVEAAMVYMLRHPCGKRTSPGSYERLTRDLERWILRSSGVAGGRPPPTTTPRPFLDFAGHARRIRGAGWDDVTLEVCGLDELRDGCFHTGSQPILNLVHRGAYGEVRSKVLLTVGALLPPKLTELVLQNAFVAEDLPAERSWCASERSALQEYGERECAVLQSLLDRRSDQLE